MKVNEITKLMSEFNKAARDGRLQDAIGGGKIRMVFPLFKRNLVVMHIDYGDNICLWYMKPDSFAKNARSLILMSENK